jgi:hypothetical protein
MIEIQFLGCVVGRYVLLNLCDEEVMSPRSDVTSLFVIEIVIVGEHLDVVIGSLITPVNTNLDVVIVQSHEGESTLGSFTEEEAKWVEV